MLTRVIERSGVELFKITWLPTGPGKAEDLAAMTSPVYNLKVIPSVQKGAPPDVKQLTALTMQNMVPHKLLEGKATVDFGTSPEDPLHLLRPIEVLKGIYCELDFDLSYGEVVYRYNEQT